MMKKDVQKIMKQLDINKLIRRKTIDLNGMHQQTMFLAVQTGYLQEESDLRISLASLRSSLDATMQSCFVTVEQKRGFERDFSDLQSNLWEVMGMKDMPSRQELLEKLMAAGAFELDFEAILKSWEECKDILYGPWILLKEEFISIAEKNIASDKKGRVRGAVNALENMLAYGIDDIAYRMSKSDWSGMVQSLLDLIGHLNGAIRYLFADPISAEEYEQWAVAPAV